MTIPRASYQILIINPTTGLVEGIIDSQSVVDIQYSRILNGIGRLAVTLPADDRWNALFTLDTLVEIYRTHPVLGTLQKEETYFVRIFNRSQTAESDLITFGGLSLNHILTRRVINPNDDPLVAGAYSTKAGHADTVIYDYVNEQMGTAASLERQMPNFSIELPTGIADGAGARLSYENLYDEMLKLAKAGKTDIIVERTTGNNLKLYIKPIGVDRTKLTNYPLKQWVGLSPIRGNLPEAALALDRSSEKNFVYELGNGEGSRRDILEVPGSGMADSPWNRCEFSEDSRGIERNDALGLLTGALNSLYENRYKQEFSMSCRADEPGNAYKDDWDLGDLVTVLFNNMEFNLRISEVSISFSETEETINVQVEQLNY
jgi:hypothetical protein